MNTERFESLAEAFGGDISRWPIVERDAAAVLMAAQAEWAQSVLGQAHGLDAMLQAYVAPRVSASLADRILEDAPRQARWPAFLWPAGLGAGLAAACAAGVVAGIHLSTPSLAVEPADPVTMAVGYDAFDFDLDGDV